MDDKKRSNDELVDQILREAHSLRETRVPDKKPDASEAWLDELLGLTKPDPNSPAPVKDPDRPASPRVDPAEPARKRLFGHRKRHLAEEPEEIEDVYYGLPMKPIEEFQKELDGVSPERDTQEEHVEEENAAFDPDRIAGEELDEEIASRFRELHEERRRRVQEALNHPAPRYTTGSGFLRPLPKKSGVDHGEEIFSVTPGAQVHNHDLEEETEPVTLSVDSILKEVHERAKSSPAANEEKKAQVKPAVPSIEERKPPQPEKENRSGVFEWLLEEQKKFDESQKGVEPERIHHEKTGAEPDSGVFEWLESAKLSSPVPQAEEKPAPERGPVPQADEKSAPKPQPAPQAESKPATKREPGRRPEKKPTAGRTDEAGQAKTQAPDEIDNPFVDQTPRQPKMPREAREGPSYAPHTKPVHLMDLDVLDFALREESRYYEEKMRREKEAEAERRKKKYLKLRKQKAVKKGFVLNGEEPENDPHEEVEEVPEELEDFNSLSDAPSVSHDLRSNMRELLLRVLVTGLCTGLLGLFGLLGEFQPLFLQQVSGEITAGAYIALNLIFLLLSVGFCYQMIWNGLKALLRFRANSDSGVALAAAAAVLQSIYACFVSDSVMSGSLHLYSVLASGALLLNSVGKLMMIRRIWLNFRFVSSRETKYAVQLYDDYNTSLKLAKGCVADSPVIAYQQKAGFLTRFLQLSYESDPLENNSQMLAPLGFAASLVMCIVSLVLTRDVAQALSAFTACACICVPFTGLLGGNVLLHRLAALGKKCGAMVVGYPAVERFSNANAVMVDARELFPRGTILLNGIKTFGNQRIDEAIMDATALMCAAGGPLVSVFDQIVKTRREVLPRVDKPVYEDGRGITGWVSGHRVLIGNRDLLAAHQINPPSHDYEEKYTVGGKKAAYLAIGGQLVAMFILSYHPDSHRARELQRMEANGISLIVRTCDPNISSAFLANSFGLDPHSVRILPDILGEEFLRVSEEVSPKAAALLATRGRAASMIRMLSACVRTHSNLTMAAVMQTLAVIIGFVLVAFLVCTTGQHQLTTLTLIIYEVFWIFVILFVPRLHKP
ncbi:MAG TPA: hypothetical protein IAA80_10805 [Candidatus Gallacutalibacter pullistercoris]|nr:hypothetical protein [Candidatus Gallacutalibacter pullistercoris]